MKIKFDEERALAVFKAIEKPYRERTGIYADFTLPQDRFPWETANELFFLSLFERGGMISGDSMKFLWQLKEDAPDIYEPSVVVARWTPEKIEEAFKAVAPKVLNGNGTGDVGAGSLSYKLGEHTRAWHENALILHKHWGGDIRNVFWGVSEFEEAFRRVDYYKNPAGFKGMRRKIFSLLTIWLQERNFAPIFPGPIPVDFHAMRVLWITDILKLRGFAKPFEPKDGLHAPSLKGKMVMRVSEKFMDTTAKWSQKFIAQNGMDHMVINPAIWLLSRDLCAEQFQNTIKSGPEKNGALIKEQEEALSHSELSWWEIPRSKSAATSGEKNANDPTRGKRMRRFRQAKLRMRFVESKDLRKNSALWPKSYKDPCGHCPIQEWCSWSIPAAPFYTWGLLVRNGARVPFPNQLLPGLVCPSTYQSRKRSRS